MIFINIISIRGAITVEENTSSNILKNTSLLLEEIMKLNNIKKSDIISILFTATRDLDQEYPAKAARKLGLLKCSLLCFQEMHVENSLNKCIRILILLNSNTSQDDVKNIYLKGASSLRNNL